MPTAFATSDSVNAAGPSCRRTALAFRRTSSSEWSLGRGMRVHPTEIRMRNAPALRQIRRFATSRRRAPATVDNHVVGYNRSLSDLATVQSLIVISTASADTRSEKENAATRSRGTANSFRNAPKANAYARARIWLSRSPSAAAFAISASASSSASSAASCWTFSSRIEIWRLSARWRAALAKVG